MEWTTPSPSSRTSSGTSRRRVQTEIGTASQTIAMSNGGAKNPPTDGEASDLAMRLLKRMKPNDLRKIRKAAKVLEKTKIENMKKVNDFVAKNENFVDLVGECYICLEPLLNNIGTTKFGVVSWKCRCTVPQKAHAACLFSKISRAPHGRATCDMCSSPIKFERTMKGNNEATIRFQNDSDKEEDMAEDEESSRSDSSEENSSASSEDSSSSNSTSSEDNEDL